MISIVLNKNYKPRKALRKKKKGFVLDEALNRMWTVFGCGSEFHWNYTNQLTSQTWLVYFKEITVKIN